LNPQAGGAETHLHEVFGRLAKKGHEISLLCSGFEGASPRDTLDGMEVHRVGRRMTFGLHLLPYLKRSLDPDTFDVVVEDLNKVPVFMPFWTKSPVVLLVHHLFGGTAFREASFPVAAATWLLERPVPRAFKDIPAIAVSESTLDDLRDRGFSGGEIAVVPNGVELDRLTPGTRAGRFPEPTLLYVGRLKRYKGIDLLLRAAAHLRDRGSRVRLLVAGRGEHRGRLEKLRSRLDLGDSVEFLGYVAEDEKIRLFQRSWIHVLTSPKEGWGISILEAAACGTPTIASNSPGLRDAVQDGKTGLLVHHGDVAALASAISGLLADGRRREGMGDAARSFAEEFTWETSARKMELFLERRVAGVHPHA
jgi:glycosyltransferase involved in cell wall biosynthesis